MTKETKTHRLRLEKLQVMVLVSSFKAADLIKQLFQELGFRNIVIALDTAEAISTMREMRIDFIVTDCEIKPNPLLADIDHITMPGQEISALTGIHFVRRLRHSPASPNPYIPVIMLVNNPDGNVVSQARDAGVNEILLKPMSAQHFCERIISIIDNPRNFVTAESYKGPCRRRKGKPPEGVSERRVREVRVLRCDEVKKKP